MLILAIDRDSVHAGDDLISQVIAAGGEAGMSKDDVLAQLAFIVVAATTTSADQLGITRQSLYRRMEKHGLRDPGAEG